MTAEENAYGQFESAVTFVQDCLHPVMVDGAYSLGLLTELAGLSFISQETVLRIVEEIRLMERGMEAASTTKPATVFKGPHLAGYWHKHYFAAAFIPENLRLEMHWDDTVERVWGKYQGQIITQAHVDELVQSVVHENLRSRATASRLTGEWLIFSTDQGKRTYLTSANHAEDDQAIAERIHRHESVDRAVGWDWRTIHFKLGLEPG